MKKITLLILLLLAFDFSYGQTTLSAGDIVITGFNSDNPDELTFVLLTDITNTTTIKFTDNGWQTSNSFRANEGTITWTATSDLSCGTEIKITDNSPFSATIGNVTDSAGFALSVSGDQILAYQGADSTPTFIYAVHFDGSSGWSANSTSASTSAIPSGLTNGTNAIAINETDNAKYNCSVTSNSSLILAANSDSSNWISSNSILPLGGCSYSCGDCLTVVTWDGTSWDTLPTTSTYAIIDGDYSGGSFSACSLQVNATHTLTVSNGNFVEIENDVIVDGDLIVETQGNFVQNDDAGTFILNGIARVNKQTATKTDWFYYTYWSSPVNNETIGSVFPDVDGDRRFKFNAANFVDTNSDNIDDNGDAWQAAYAGETIAPGAGYAVTESRFFMGGSGTATFEGAFNTGDITTNISYNPVNTNSWNFIGNPYPSAIDFDAFHAANSTVVEGAAYFWSQATAHDRANGGNEESNFSRNDYATYTVGSGGVAGASGITPNQYIPTGQGFFIAGSSTNTVTFTNAMRMADATSNLLFFKGSKKSKSTNSENRLWVNLTTENGVFSQILLAYVDNATDGDDGLSFDAPKLANQDFAAILYSSIDSDNKKYVIQGMNSNSLNEDEVIKLGFSSTIESNTEYKFSIAQFEGEFISNNTVYLIDKLSNTVHNLSDSDYTFTSEEGEFNDRFEIRFNSTALSTQDIDLNSDTLKIIELENDNVQFTASKSIQSIRIFDLLGRQLYQFEGNNTSETYKLSNLNSSVYIAKVTLLNGITISKKAFKK